MRSSTGSWNPQVFLWDGGWLGFGRSAGVVPPHRHHAIQICLGLDRGIGVRAAEGDWLQVGGAIVRPDEEHSFDSAGALCAMLFVDPECHEGRWLLHSLRETVTPIAPEKLAPCRALLGRIHVDPPGATETAS